MTNKELANCIKNALDNNGEEIIETLKKSANDKEATLEISKKFHLKNRVAKEMLGISIFNVSGSTKDILKDIYTSEKGEKAFIKICKDKKLNIIRTSLFNKKDYEKIYSNPCYVYEIIDKKYKHLIYNKRQRLLDSIYFQAFKNI